MERFLLQRRRVQLLGAPAVPPDPEEERRALRGLEWTLFATRRLLPLSVVACACVQVLYCSEVSP